MTEFQTAILAGLACAAVLVLEHLLFYRQPWRLWPPAAYSIGTATIGGIFTAWCWAWGYEPAAVAFWTIAIIGGGSVICAWWARGRFERLRQQHVNAGHMLSQRLEGDSDDGASRGPRDLAS